MKNPNILIFCFILNLIYFKSNSLKCGGEEIENCEKCGTGEKANTCIECKDKYFLFFNNLYCIPCNDPLYGNVGCVGSCDSTNYLKDSNIMCNECKEGFFKLNGFCLDCTYGSPGCKRCSLKINERNQVEYICNECFSNEYRLDSSSGKCYHYGKNNCKKCHFDKENNSVCDVW